MKTNEPNRSGTGWVFYDGDCRFCVAAALRFAPLLRRHRFEFAPLQTAWVRQKIGLKSGEPPAEMKLLADERVYGGADALLQIARTVWWAWPLYVVSFLPGVKTLLRTFYRWFAARRNCMTRQCTVGRPRHLVILDWIPLFVLPVGAWFLTRREPAWINMWALVLALVWGFKWAIWRKAERKNGHANLAQFAEFFCWPGMDAEGFSAETQTPQIIDRAEWMAAGLKVFFGAALTWGGARCFAADQPLLAGWIGMIGLAFMLHFGFFHLLALIWRRNGVAVEPIMRAPILSQSLGEFWGQRWNLAFNKLAYDFGFTPLKRRLGIAGATLAVFAVSGLIHELVISVPARGGYGQPTMYFLIQGLGVVIERTRFAKRFGIGRGFRGWLFTAICTAGPAFWLFHPIFVRNVILPMLRAIGAT